ncbi:MAG: ATP-binding protein [Planctomycetota bacterium]|jgi:PAS domain S-box-containing protein
MPGKLRRAALTETSGASKRIMIAEMTSRMCEQNPGIAEPDKKTKAKSTGFIILYLLIVVGFVAIGPKLFSSAWISSSDFHSCIEICSSFIAIIAAVACLMYYFGLKKRYYLICGLGFFICGGEGFIHGLLSFSRLFSGAEADLSKFVPGTYVAGRSMFAVFITLAAVLKGRSRSSKNVRKETVFFSSVAMIVACGVTALAIMLPLPRFIYPEKLISRPVDFASAVLFAIAFVMVLKKYLHERSVFSGFLLSCILLNLGGQIYMSFSKQLFDAFFDLAHWVNILSYCMPVLGIAIQALTEMKNSERELVIRKHAEKSLQEHRDHLEEVVEKRTSELQTANKGLKTEITERKQAEDELHKSESKYRTLFENLPQKIFLKDRNSAYVSCNENFAADLKIKPEEIAGKTDCDFHPEELANKYRADDERVMKSKKAEDIEESYLLDGEETIVHTVKTPVKDEHGNVAGVLGIFWDITELKLAEQKINELAKFVSENPNPIIKISKDFTILYANDAGAPLLETWGCEEGQRLPQPHSKLVEKVLSSGEALTCELESTSEQVFSVTLAPVVKLGYVNVYGLDITELRLSKEYLKQVRKQAEVKSQFVSTVSHELRTPLTTMKEGVSIVLDGIAGEINNKQKHFLDIIRRNIDRLARFINDVLDFQKLEAGKMEVDMRSNNMNEVVEEVIETMSSLANEKGLDLIAKLDEAMPAVDFDKDRIIQVLINLVNNAIKFTDTGNITIATAKADDTVRISVHDTGPGIKKENLPRLFHEFEQLSDTNERKTGGSGLGLVISRRIIEKHNGKIWVESESGKGTSFYFELPVQAKKALAMAE